MSQNVIIQINGEIDKSDLYDPIHAITHYDNELGLDKSPIYLAFNSGGGDAVYGLGLFYFLKGFTNRRIISLNIGKCSSAVLMPYMACTTKLAIPKSIFGVHHAFKEENGIKKKLLGAYQTLQEQQLPQYPEIQLALSEIDPMRTFSAENFREISIVDEICSKSKIYTKGSNLIQITGNDVKESVI